MHDANAMTPPRPELETKRSSMRTCVGCGARDDARELLRLVVAGDEIAFDLAGGSFGRGAHVHPRPECLGRAPRGLGRALRRFPGMRGEELGERLSRACDARMAGLLLAARRLRAVVVGADATIDAIARAEAGAGEVLVVVATDAGVVASRAEVQRAVARGRAIGWAAKSELGRLLGEQSVAICAVRHAAIAAELKRMRAAADAGAAMTNGSHSAAAGARSEDRGAECSRRPEAR